MFDLFIQYVTAIKADPNVKQIQLVFALFFGGGLPLIFINFITLIYIFKGHKTPIALITIGILQMILGIFFIYSFYDVIHKGYVYEDLQRFLLDFTAIGLCPLVSLASWAQLITIKKLKLRENENV